ncbi:unnamed protein product [Didymodactylos carnosus]|uniref:Major facilitator superfamily (MFS) profile domain-containing protein n=1 Tax=Didymodactylos carnosus TaxID=1234261 RepID=A0A814AUA5_9BILA|nr:unnamed protein product [Didymodactylos carnosus]CAF3697112.1 unnamed protein product [Didymodactylos carnosus]
MLINEILPQNVSDELLLFVTYKRRWFYLFIICLAQISNAMIWINFSPIADIATQYYSVNYDAINWLSLIYMAVTIPFTLPSTWIIDKIGIKSGMIIGSWLNALGSFIRVISTWSFLSIHSRFPIVLLGQFLCAVAQTYILFIPTKFSFVWFSEKQRSLANSIAIGSNYFGILMGSILSPLIVKHKENISLLLYINVAPALLAALFSVCIRTSNPPTPSCVAMTDVKQPFFVSLKKLLYSKSYIMLFIGCGFALACFNTLSTLVEQMMCPFGYDDMVVGFCLGYFIGAGTLGVLVFGYFADKTGKLEEISKILYGLSSLAYITIVLLIINQVPKYFLYLIFAIVGFVSLPILPLSMDLSIECTHPIAEATATGINFMSSQILGIIMVTVLPRFGRSLNEAEMLVQKCSVAHGVILDYTIPLYAMAIMMILTTIVYICCFKCDYKRRHFVPTEFQS